MQADVIPHGRDGRIAGRVTHRERMRQKGCYHALYVRHNL